jgi:hypothetical protein
LLVVLQRGIAVRVRYTMAAYFSASCLVYLEVTQARPHFKLVSMYFMA